jgi:hypothetical protein
MDTTKLLFKDYLNVPSNKPTGEWYDEGDEYNNYIIGDQVFVDPIPKEPVFIEEPLPEEYKELTCEKYYIDETGVLEKFEKLTLKTVQFNAWYQTANNINILKNALQFNYDPSSQKRFDYILYINNDEIFKTNTTYNWLFNYKSGYITFYENPPINTTNVQFTFVRYRGNIGLANFTGGNVVNKIITGNSLNYYQQMNNQTLFMNARSVGMNDLDVSSNKYILTYKDLIIQNIQLTAYGITEPITYDISAVVLINTVPTTYSIGSFTLSPLSNEYEIPVYDNPIDRDGLIAHFKCDGTNKNEINTPIKLLGGTFTSSDKKVGLSSLMIPTGGSATIANADFTMENWTVSFWYKLVNAYHDGSDMYLMYFHNPQQPSLLNFKVNYDLSTNKLGFGLDNVQKGEPIDLFMNWSHISLTKSDNVYTLYVNNEEYLSAEFELVLESTTLEFANYEPIISESASYMNDIRIYDKAISEYDLAITPKSSLAVTTSQITEFTIPAKSIVFIQISKREHTYINEIVELQLNVKKDEKLDIGNKIVFEKAFQYIEDSYSMNTGINMELIYNDELGNQGEVDFPFKSFHILDQPFQLKQLFFTHHDFADETVMFDISLIQIDQTEEVLYQNRLPIEKLIYNRPRSTYTSYPDNMIRCYTCDSTFKNIQKSMDVSASLEGAQLMGGIFKNIASPVWNSSLYNPKGTGITLTEFDWNIPEWTFSFWYRQEHSTEKRRNMIFHFNDPRKHNGNPYGIYMMYDASNTSLFIGYRNKNEFIEVHTQSSVNMVDTWTHIAISKKDLEPIDDVPVQQYSIYLNKTEIYTFEANIIWNKYVVEFCNWVPSLLKNAAFFADISIFNEAIVPNYEIQQSTNTFAIKQIILPTPIELKKNAKLKIRVTPHIPRRGYLKIELIPDIPYNSSFSDTDGILKYTMIQKHISDHQKILQLNSHPVNSKYRLEQPYFMTFKLKKINSFSIIKNNNLNSTYDLFLKYGSLSYTGSRYEIKIANEYPLTYIQNISNELNFGLGEGYSIQMHPENVIGGLIMWFLCDGHIDNYITGIPTKLLGGVYTTTDYKVGNSCLMLNKGSGASITTYDWSGTWTISFWFKYVSTTFIDQIPIIWFGSKSHTKEIEDGVQILYDPSNNKVYLSKYNQVYNSIDASLNEWTLITLCKENDEYTLYVGEEIITQTVEGVTWDDQGNMLEFGQFEGGNINTACYIDDIRVYNRVLSDVDITKLNTVESRSMNAKCTYYTLKNNIVIPENSVIIIEGKRNTESTEILDIREEAYFQFYADDVTNDVIIDLLNNGVFYAQSGTETNPTYSFLEDRDTGIYLSGENEIAFTAGGNTVMKINSNDITIGNKSTNNLVFTEDTNKPELILNDITHTFTQNYERIYLDKNNNVINEPHISGSTVYIFKSNIDTDNEGTIRFNNDVQVEYLVVGGGGSGTFKGISYTSHYTFSAAGGAGGYNEGFLNLNKNVDYSLRVGRGGIYPISDDSIDVLINQNLKYTQNGNDSILHTIISYGGGGAGQIIQSVTADNNSEVELYKSIVAGNDGGSGGGSVILEENTISYLVNNTHQLINPELFGGKSIPLENPQGSNGGNGTIRNKNINFSECRYSSSGAGGGANVIGENAKIIVNNSLTIPENAYSKGGDGKISTITGQSLYYAAGGSSGIHSTNNIGGGTGLRAVQHTGSGGGGAYPFDNANTVESYINMLGNLTDVPTNYTIYSNIFDLSDPSEYVSGAGGVVIIKFNSFAVTDIYSRSTDSVRITGDYISKYNDINGGIGVRNNGINIWVRNEESNILSMENEVIHVNLNKKVGINKDSPIHDLDVSGTIMANNMIATNITTSNLVANAITETSDIRLKTNIQHIQSSLHRILNLNGVTFNWKNHELNKHVIYNGFIAQEVKKHIPEVVHGNEETDMLSISYTGLIPYLVESIKELKQENNELREEINKIKQR